MKNNFIPTFLFWALSLSVILAALYTFPFGSLNRSGRRGSPIAHCKINIMNAQQAMRAYQNAKGLKTGSPLQFEELIAAGYFPKVFDCPDGNPYLCDNSIPEPGHLYFKCTNPQHMQFDHEAW